MLSAKKQISYWCLLAGLGAAVLAILGNPVFVRAAEGDYVGAKRCRPCHMPESRSWAETKMAKSFELLKPGVAADAKKAHNLDPAKDYTSDASCLSCHTTGYGQGGFVSLDKTPDLAGVSCESCHGPGAGYLKPNLMSLKNKEYKRADLLATGMILPEAKVCETCHNEKNPFHKPFDYEELKSKGIHQIRPLKFKH